VESKSQGSKFLQNQATLVLSMASRCGVYLQTVGGKAYHEKVLQNAPSAVLRTDTPNSNLCHKVINCTNLDKIKARSGRLKHCGSLMAVSQSTVWFDGIQCSTLHLDVSRSPVMLFRRAIRPDLFRSKRFNIEQLRILYSLTSKHLRLPGLFATRSCGHVEIWVRF
jgi:hypothetical protein